MKPCVVCGKRVCRPRGLCWHCYSAPEIRERIPRSETRHNRQGHGLGTGSGGIPASATDTAPGSDARLAVYALRAEAGLRLWHPADRRREDCSPEELRQVQAEEKERRTYLHSGRPREEATQREGDQPSAAEAAER